MTLTTNAESRIPAFAHLSFYLDFIRHDRDNIDIVLYSRHGGALGHLSSRLSLDTCFDASC
jgi:hypothetical protein